MNKIIVSMIVTGLLSTTFIASVDVSKSASTAPFANIYVDDDNTQGPWDGTLEHPYQYIKDGINAANPGDTVFVFNGIYNNDTSIDVRKSIKLLGEDKYNTIIDKPYFKVNEVNGFEIRNFCLGCSTPNIELNDCSHCIISGNIITLTGTYGILLSNCSNCTASDNNIQAYPQFGTCILDNYGENNEIKDNYLYGGAEGGAIGIDYESYNSIISNNTIDNFYKGIVLGYDSRAYVTDNTINNTRMGLDILYSSKHTISGNKITNNYEGITLGFSDNVTISDNIVTDSSLNGISLSNGKNIDVSHNIIDNNPCGIAFCFIENSICSNNTITNSSESGIDIMDSGSIAGNNLISYNNVNNCYCGIMLENSWGNTYKNNIVNYNEFGIMLYGKTHFNVVTKNEVGKNGVGVELYGFIAQNNIYAPFGNWIVGNNICENTNCSIYATVLTSSNHIYYNNFIDNYQNAYDKGTNIWYKLKIIGSMGNYWSNYDEASEGAYDDNEDGIADTPYDIPPWPFRNTDRFPCMEPIDIENTASSYSELIQSNSQPSSQPGSQQSNPSPQNQPSSQSGSTTTQSTTGSATSK